MSAPPSTALMRSRPSNLLANHRASERASECVLSPPRLSLSFSPSATLALLLPPAVREKGRTLYYCFYCPTSFSPRTAGWIGLWRLLNFDVTKSLLHFSAFALPPPARRSSARSIAMARGRGSECQGGARVSNARNVMILLEFKFHKRAYCTR